MRIFAIPFEEISCTRDLKRKSEGLFIGVWRSWLAHLVWDQRVVGSNPTRPTFWQTLFGQSAATSKTCYSRVPKYATTSRFSCVRALPQKSLRQNKSRALKVPTIICVGCCKKNVPQRSAFSAKKKRLTNFRA